MEEQDGQIGLIDNRAKHHVFDRSDLAESGEAGVLHGSPGHRVNDIVQPVVTELDGLGGLVRQLFGHLAVEPQIAARAPYLFIRPDPAKAGQGLAEFRGRKYA